MRRFWICVVAAACFAHHRPAAVRIWYVVQNGSTFDGASSPTPALDVSKADRTAIILRGRSANGATEGIGLEAGDGTYDVAFFRRLPEKTNYPPYAVDEDVMLLVAHRDGTGAIAYPDRSHGPLHATARGTELALTGPGDAQTLVHLGDNAQATVSGHFHAVRAVYAEFGDTVVIAASTRGYSTDLCVGRYDFTHGRGENAGLHGRGTETFTAQSTTASD